MDSNLSKLDRLALINSAMIYKITIENDAKDIQTREDTKRLERVEEKLDLIMQKLGIDYE